MAVLLKLSSFSVSDTILVQLSEFHVNCVNDCLYCINCLVSYKVEELKSRYGAKLQHVFLTFFFWCIYAKMSKSGLRTKKLWK